MVVASDNRCRRDSGFSLAELLVVLALLGVIITISFSALQVASKGADVQEREAYFAINVSSPLQGLDKTISQNTTLVATGGSVCNTSTMTFYADQDLNGTYEKHVVQAGTNGELTEQIFIPYSAGTPTRTVKWSVQNTNKATGIPLFTYRTRNASGTPIASSVASATEVQIQVATEWESRAYSDTRLVVFRNR